MALVTIANARILTLAGEPGPRRGDAMANLGVIERGAVTFQDDRIIAVESGDPESRPDAELLDVDGQVLMPSFVDCHTHTCWAGSRADEFEMKLRGATYLDILKSGGGIMSTVRAVREMPEDQLAMDVLHRLGGMAAQGTATVEIKSGYGLTTEDELKMIRAIHMASTHTTQIVVGTFLGAHALDPDNPDLVEEMISETLPAVASEFPGIVCDAYCEEGAWSLEDTRRLFERAIEFGCPIRVHADQFNALGMTSLAVELSAISVDHLEATTPDELKKLAASTTMGVMLPICGFHLDDRYAPGREFLDAGGALALATNYNPGSAPSPSMAFAIALACRKMRLTPAEAIMAATHNAACVLGIQDQVGTIEVGKRADLQVLDCTDERELAFHVATPGPLLSVVKGTIAHIRSFDPGGDDDRETNE